MTAVPLRPVLIAGGFLLALIAVPAILAAVDSDLSQPFQIAFSSAAVAVAALSALVAARAAQNARDQTELTRIQIRSTLRPFVGAGVPHKRQEDFNRNVWHIPIQNFGTVPAVVRMTVRLESDPEDVELRAGQGGTGLSGFTGGMLMPGQQESLALEIQHRSILNEMFSGRDVRLTLTVSYADPAGVVSAKVQQEFRFRDSAWAAVPDDQA